MPCPKKRGFSFIQNPYICLMLKISKANPIHFKYNTEAGSGSDNEGNAIRNNLLLADITNANKVDPTIEHNAKWPQLWGNTDETVIQIETDLTKTILAVVYDASGSPVYSTPFAATNHPSFQEATIDWSDAAFSAGDCYTVKIVSYDTATLGSNLFTYADNGTCQANINDIFTGSNNSIIQSPTMCPTSQGAKVTNNISGTDADLVMVAGQTSLATGKFYKFSANMGVPSLSGYVSAPQPNIGFDLTTSHPTQLTSVWTDGLQINTQNWNESHGYDICHPISADLFVGPTASGSMQILCDRIAGVNVGGNVQLDAFQIQEYTSFAIEAESEIQKIIANTENTFKIGYSAEQLALNIYFEAGPTPDLFFRIDSGFMSFFDIGHDGEIDGFVKSDGGREYNISRVYSTQQANITAVPWFIYDKLMYALAHPSFTIDEIFYGLQSEFQLQRLGSLPFFSGEMKLFFIADDLGTDDYKNTECG